MNVNSTNHKTSFTTPAIVFAATAILLSVAPALVGSAFGDFDESDAWAFQPVKDEFKDTAVIDLRLDIDRNRLLASTQGRGAWVIGLCAADLTGDGVVDIDDLFAVLAAWGQSGVPEDVNGDGVVDIDDVFAILAAWGPCE